MQKQKVLFKCRYKKQWGVQKKHRKLFRTLNFQNVVVKYHYILNIQIFLLPTQQTESSLTLLCDLKQGRGSGFVQKPDPELCTSNEGRFSKVYRMNIIDI